MSIVKSFAVGAGDMFYIRHNSDNFTMIDCDLGDDNAERIIAELSAAPLAEESIALFAHIRMKTILAASIFSTMRCLLLISMSSKTKQ